MAKLRDHCDEAAERQVLGLQQSLGPWGVE